MTVSPDGKHVYTAGIDGGVAVFGRNATTGALTFVESEIDGFGGVDGLAFARDVLVSPDGAHVYVAGLGDDAVAIFARNATSGALDFVGTVKDGVGGVDGLDGAIALAFAPDGTRLYVAGNVDHAIAVFTRDAGTGLLTFVEVEKDAVNGVDGLVGVSDLAVSGDGAHVYAVAATASALTTFARDATTGALTFQSVLRDGVAGIEGLGGAGAVAVAPNGLGVFTTAQQDDAVASFGRDASTGALSFRKALKDGAGVSGLGSAAGLVVSPDGSYVYVGGFDANQVLIFAVQ